MNIIFLDFDGVLNSECFFLKRMRNMQELKMIDVNSLDEDDEHVKYLLCQIDLYNIDLLKEVIDETNSKIVVISSWKRLSCFKKVSKHLINLGLPIIDVTIDNGSNRGKGIKDYLNTHNVSNYVVIDDEVFEDYDEELLSHLVKTKFYDSGFVPENADEAIKLLKK